jgi:hypothetical protein
VSSLLVIALSLVAFTPPVAAASSGVFRLRIVGGRCATAHKVATDWMARFEANIRAGHIRLPKSVA